MEGFLGEGRKKKKPRLEEIEPGLAFVYSKLDDIE